MIFVQSNIHVGLWQVYSLILTWEVNNRAVGTGRGGMLPQILADQLTLFQPEGQIMPTTLKIILVFAFAN